MTSDRSEPTCRRDLDGRDRLRRITHVVEGNTNPMWQDGYEAGLDSLRPSQMCERAGCSSEALAERVIQLEAEVSLYRATLEKIRDDDSGAAAFLQLWATDALKGEDAK